MRPSNLALLLCLTWAIACMSPTSQAQVLSQTLPAGFEMTQGGATTDFPLNTTADQFWQWHYDSGQFVTSGEILIQEVYVRADNGASSISPFEFTNFDVTLIEASTNQGTGSHNSTFSLNVDHQRLVRSGRFAGRGQPASGGAVGTWFSLQLQDGFLYDPRRGHDLIIQIRKCGTLATIGAMLDGVSNSSVSRHGAIMNCSATTSDFNQAYAPILKIDYRPVLTQTLPFGFDTTPGTGTSLPFNSSSDQIWQWHYDTSEFNTIVPITIKDLGIRSGNNTAIGAFDFGLLSVVLGEAATNYTVAAHNPNFAANLLRSDNVHGAAFTGAGLAPSPGSVGNWQPFNLRSSFWYDPTTGNDFIVQLQTCGVNATFGTTIDGSSGSPGANGGNRYGDLSSCSATVATFNNNEFVPVTRISYFPAIVNSFPWHEDFNTRNLADLEDPPIGWLQPKNDGSQDWTFIGGPTSSSNTGPPADHTTGVPGQGGYAYTEDSNGENASLNLLTPVLNFIGVANPRMSFWVHSRDASSGLTSNSLSVDAVLYPSGATSFNLIPTIGNIGDDDWHEMVVNLASLAGQRVQIRFRGTTDGGSFTHDIAIDDITIVDFQGGAGQAPQPGLALLDINESQDANGFGFATGVTGPFSTDVRVGDALDMYFAGAPNQPIVVLAGSLNPGIVLLPGIGRFDIGSGPILGGVPSNLFLVADGTLGTAPDFFFRTQGNGELELSFPTPNLPPGLLFNLQAIFFTGGASVIAMSNTVQVNITL
ncbi:MAG: hypothetical protein KDB53_20060 [Planctomycetes bacterium]|nr:hypothetical protein [Planctomycetota bacterium]